jgi:hypothetical protein
MSVEFAVMLVVFAAIEFVFAVILAVFAFTLFVNVNSAALAVVASEVIAVAFVAIEVVFAVILAVFAATFVGKVAIVLELTPPTEFIVVANDPFPEPVTSPVNAVVALAAITSVPISNPKFVLAAAAVAAPVPPFAIAIVPESVDAFVAMVMFAVPSKATPLMVRAVVNLAAEFAVVAVVADAANVAVAAFPSISPVTFEPETVPILASVTDPFASFMVLIAPSATFVVVTLPFASFEEVTALDAILGAAAVPLKSPANCKIPFVVESASAGVTPTGIVIFAVPSNGTPLMVRGVSKAVALAAKLASLALEVREST